MKSKKSYAPPVLTELGQLGLDRPGKSREVDRVARELALASLRSRRRRMTA